MGQPLPVNMVLTPRSMTSARTSVHAVNHWLRSAGMLRRRRAAGNGQSEASFEEDNLWFMYATYIGFCPWVVGIDYLRFSTLPDFEGHSNVRTWRIIFLQLTWFRGCWMWEDCATSSNVAGVPRCAPQLKHRCGGYRRGRLRVVGQSFEEWFAFSLMCSRVSPLGFFSVNFFFYKCRTLASSGSLCPASSTSDITTKYPLIHVPRRGSQRPDLRLTKWRRKYSTTLVDPGYHILKLWLAPWPRQASEPSTRLSCVIASMIQIKFRARNSNLLMMDQLSQVL